jgi:hypothetical protein
MGEEAQPQTQPRRGLSISLRVKIILAFCILSALVSLALATSTYLILDRNLFQELRSRVRDLTDIGSLTLDRDAVGRLAARLAEGVSEEQAEEIQASEDFRRVSDGLNRIRGVEPQLVRFIYTFVPTDDPAWPVPGGWRRVAGLHLPQRRPIEEDVISALASEFDISEFPVAQQVIAESATWSKASTPPTRTST